MAKVVDVVPDQVPDRDLMNGLCNKHKANDVAAALHRGPVKLTKNSLRCRAIWSSCDRLDNIDWVRVRHLQSSEASSMCHRAMGLDLVSLDSNRCPRPNRQCQPAKHEGCRR